MSRAPRAVRRAVMQVHALHVQMDMSRLVALRLAQSATRAASPAERTRGLARRVPADTTSPAAHARPASLTAGASRASRAVRAARLQPAALVLFSATSWGWCWAPLLTSLWVCLHGSSCHAYPYLPAGCVAWWQSAPEAVSRTLPPLHAEPCLQALTMHLIYCPHLSESSCCRHTIPRLTARPRMAGLRDIQAQLEVS